MVLKRCSSERGEREKRFYGVGEFPATLTGLDDDGVRVEYRRPIYSLPIDDDGAPAPVRTSTRASWDDIFFTRVVVPALVLGILVVLVVLVCFATQSPSTSRSKIGTCPMLGREGTNSPLQ